MNRGHKGKAGNQSPVISDQLMAKGNGHGFCHGRRSAAGGMTRVALSEVEGHLSRSDGLIIIVVLYNVDWVG